MSAKQGIERSMLDGKDREELHSIAGAIGLKGVTRLKKADLVAAILSAAGGDGDAKAPKAPRSAKASAGKEASAATDSGKNSASATSATPRKAIRSKRASELEAGSIESLAAEQDAIASSSGLGSNTDPEIAPRPRRNATPTSSATTNEPQTSGVSGVSGGTDSGSESRVASQGGTGSGSEDGDEQGSYSDANRTRRRRRRGRDRVGGPGEEGAQSSQSNQGGQGSQSNQGRQGRQGGQGGQNRQGGQRPERGNSRGYDRGGEREQAEPRGEFTGEPIEIAGLLDLRDEGYGFLRSTGYLPGRNDSYVSATQVRRFSLRKGDYIKGATRPAASNEKYPALLRVDEINGMSPEDAKERPRFEDLTPLFPDERLTLEIKDEPALLTGRIIDLLSPIGKGQRGLVVSPPKAGKTTILKQLVYSIERNNPEVHLMVLLVDERPEEVTDMKRHVLRGEVIASTFDRPSDEHTHVAEVAIERAKRLVELGKDVVIVLDGITRLARAYNLAAPASGRVLSGGVDSTALYPPKRFFGAARNVEEGGSLTIIATALIETGSRMDEVIFEEFKGTGNMELRLDRKLAERRLYPAIDVNASSTRHEELLFERDQLNQVWKLRRVLNALAGDGSAAPGLELLLDKLRSTKSNDEFLSDIAKAPSGGG
ncbi:transcription termination factor Rho [Actinobacteria bacterium IMCC26256]|nr:transcription termination factor Rho [Actinobacteria bacterium IMCC26256]